ncbi:MAG: sulfur carrier protein ThiS [Pirellulales bacterium]|nr:sulfur carrier protein ThiS [Pirellulales bacterium]
MQIFVNDEPQEYDDETSVAALVERLQLRPQFVAVEVNLELVPRARHAERQLRPGDRVEIVTLVGGG